MRTFEGVGTGYILGSLMMAGVWAFIEMDRRSTSCFSDIDVPRVERTAVAPVRPEPAAEAPRPTKERGPRRAGGRTARAVAAPVIARRLEPAEAPRVEPAANVEEERPGAVVVASRRARRDDPLVAVAISAGVETSLSPELGSAAQWQLRLLLEPAEHLGLEVGYVGLRGPMVAASSGEALAKWYPASRQPLRHYVLAGLGWRRFHAPLKTDVAMAALGAGLSYTRGPWRADTRLTLRLATQPGLHTVGASAHLGWTF